MKIAVEILLIWTALDVVIGIPIWLLVIKFRDHQEGAAVKAMGFAHTAYLTGVRPLPRTPSTEAEKSAPRFFRLSYGGEARPVTDRTLRPFDGLFRPAAQLPRIVAPAALSYSPSPNTLAGGHDLSFLGNRNAKGGGGSEADEPVRQRLQIMHGRQYGNLYYLLQLEGSAIKSW
jgi:hypothetical protein